MGVMVWFGLWLLGVQYPLVLGILAAAFELVPVIGPILTGVVGFLIAVSDSFSLGLYAVLFFFIVQQLENHIFVPLVMGKVMDVHPVIVVVALLVGGEVAGLIGFILAVPVAVLAQEFLNYLADQKSNRPTLSI
jgi:predicted PurR-regulated permease PerM